MSDLAKRAVACKDWKWMDGVHTPDGYVVIEPMAAGEMTLFVKGHECEWTQDEVDSIGLLPNLAHPATIGCLMAMLSEAWGFHVYMEPVYSGRGVLLFWAARGGPGLTGIEAGTLLECAVMALEAAP